MSRHVILANVDVVPECREKVLTALLEHRDRCLREEAGTLAFDVFLALDTPHHILLYEVYEDRAAFDIHLDGSSMVIFRQQTMDQIKDMAGGAVILAVDAADPVTLDTTFKSRKKMIAILARVKIKTDSTSHFLEVASKLVAASRTEPGSLGYELLRESENRYSFLERYVGEAALEAHKKTEHFRTFGRQLGDYMDGKPEIIRLESVT